MFPDACLLKQLAVRIVGIYPRTKYVNLFAMAKFMPVSRPRKVRSIIRKADFFKVVWIIDLFLGNTKETRCGILTTNMEIKMSVNCIITTVY